MKQITKILKEITEIFNKELENIETIVQLKQFEKNTIEILEKCENIAQAVAKLQENTKGEQ